MSRCDPGTLRELVQREPRPKGCLRRTVEIAVVALIVIGVLCLAHHYWFWNKYAVFRRMIADPVPRSVRNLRVKYAVGFRESSAKLYFTVSATDLEWILTTREYERIEGELLELSPLFGNPYRVFGVEGWPDPRRIAEPEVYAYFDLGCGRHCWLLTNPDHTEVHCYTYED
jgi:hypothetical protein